MDVVDDYVTPCILASRVLICWNNSFVGCLFRCPNLCTNLLSNLLTNLLTNLVVCGFALLESEKLEVE